MAFRYRAGQTFEKSKKIEKKADEVIRASEPIEETEDLRAEERRLLLARLRAEVQVIDEPELLDELVEASSQSSSSSSDPESSDDEVVLPSRPVFVPKSARGVIDELVYSTTEGSGNWRTQALESLAVAKMTGEEKAVTSGLGDWAVPLPSETQTEATEEDIDSLTSRELQRVLASRMDELRIEAEKQDKLRRSQLTEEEIRRENPERFEKQRSTEFAFMQKYYHGGAFFQDLKTTESVLQRDVHQPVEADLTLSKLRSSSIDVTAAEMKRRGQVGMRGQTKYKHLGAEDTSRSGPRPRDLSLTLSGTRGLETKKRKL